MVKLGAFAIIRDASGRVLLGHRRDRDMWNLPGGGVEAGESPWDAAVREAKEEVGLAVEVERLVDVSWKPQDSDLVFTFACRVVSGTPATSDEADAVEYFSIDALPPNMNERQAERLRTFGAGVYLRTQRAPAVV